VGRSLRQLAEKANQAARGKGKHHPGARHDARVDNRTRRDPASASAPARTRKARINPADVLREQQERARRYENQAEEKRRWADERRRNRKKK
jgi:hypothetical protein